MTAAPEKDEKVERRVEKVMVALRSGREEFDAAFATLPPKLRIVRAMSRRIRQLAEANDDRLPMLASALCQLVRGTPVGAEAVKALNVAAKALLDSHDWNEAIRLLDLVLELEPDHPLTLRYLARALFNVGERPKAVEILRSLLVTDPSYVGAAGLLARYLEPNHIVEIGRQIAPLAVSHADSHPASLTSCIRVLVRLMCFDEAAGLLPRITNFEDSEVAKAAFDIGISRNDATLASRALAGRKWRPKEQAEKDVWLMHLALVQADRRALETPFRSLAAAGKLDLLEGTLRSVGLALGRYADAFSLDWQWARRLAAAKVLGNLVQAHEPPEALAGAAVLIIANAELGDEIRLMELVDRVRRIAKSCTIVVDRRIAGLVARNRDGLVVVGTEKVAAPPRDSPVPDILRRHLTPEVWSAIDRFDKVVLTEDLQALFVRSEADLPCQPTTFATDAQLRTRWRKDLEGLPGPRVGLFWRSGRINYNRSAKFTKLEDWQPLFEASRGTFVSLQFGPDVSQEIAALGKGARVVEMAGLDTRNDLESVAALMCELDCVVSVPGTTMHLAGAVGACTLAVSHPSEALWRARLDGVTGTWSPSVEMVSGPADGGFDGAILAAARRLRTMLVART